jgi:hypothetical protein
MIPDPRGVPIERIRRSVDESERRAHRYLSHLPAVWLASNSVSDAVLDPDP